MFQESEPQSFYLCSLPRSGSSFITAELVCKTGLPLLREPWRRILGYPEDDLTASDAPGAETLDELFQRIKNPRKQFQAREMFQTIQDHAYIVKETDGIFFLDPISTSKPLMPMVYIHRPLGAVLISHFDIPDVYPKWNYAKRIDRTRTTLKVFDGQQERYSQYLEIYARADKIDLKGEHWPAMLAAHLGVQTLELGHLSTTGNLKTLEYEAVARNPEGVLKQLMENMGINYQERPRVPVNNGNTGYAHITKLTPEQVEQNILRWRARFDFKDYQALRHIFGNFFDTLFPESETKLSLPAALNQKKVMLEEKPLTERPENPPEFSFVEIDLEGKRIQVGNIPVSVEMMCAFLNLLVERGISTPHQLLLMDISKKEIKYDQESGMYSYSSACKSHPVTHVSPIAAAVYALHHQVKLGSVAVYQKLHEKLDFPETSNHADIYQTTTAPGQFQPTPEGLYDVFGNIREICLKTEGAWVYGGSFCDEPHVVKHGQLNPFPLGYSDRDVGFRLMRDPNENNQHFDAVAWLNLIQGANSDEIQSYALQLIKEAILA